MSGSWRLVAGFAACGAVITLLLSLSNNTLSTSLMRGLYAFVSFAAIGAAVRLAIGVLLRPAAVAVRAPERAEEDHRGAQVDYMTPDDPFDVPAGQAGPLGKPPAAAGGSGEAFQPLQPKRVVSLDNPDPEAVVQAIRRLTDE